MRQSAREESRREQLDAFIEAFRHPVPEAVRERLNTLHKNRTEGEALLQSLQRIYLDYGLQSWSKAERPATGGKQVPRIVCAEAL